LNPEVTHSPKYRGCVTTIYSRLDGIITNNDNAQLCSKISLKNVRTMQFAVKERYKIVRLVI